MPQPQVGDEPPTAEADAVWVSCVDHHRRARPFGGEHQGCGECRDQQGRGAGFRGTRGRCNVLDENVVGGILLDRYKRKDICKYFSR
jgi:hypothetical protein